MCVKKRGIDWGKDMDNHSTENTKDSSSVEVLGLSLPKGGGAISGIGETYTCNPFTGTFQFSLPLPTTPCRDFTPQVNLTYDSGLGNGVFGIGFMIDLPVINRKVSTGVAKYDETDVFIFSQSEELVRTSKESKRVTDLSGIEWEVIFYELKTEGLFSIFEYWKSLDSSYWRVISKDNVISIYGQDASSRIHDPKNEDKVFSWLIQSSENATGSRIEYEYKKENNSNIGDNLFLHNRCYDGNKYISNIKYGNYYNEKGQEKMAFELIFDYGEYDISEATLKKPDCKPYHPIREWPSRRDSFSTYRSGFEIRTCRLCRNVLLFHHFEKELGAEPALIKALQFSYSEEGKIDQAMMSHISSIGIRGYRRQTNGSYDMRQLPSIELAYTDFEPNTQTFGEIKTTDTLTGNIDLKNYMVVDLYGDGIPGLLQSDTKATLYYRALGNAEYTMQNPEHFPIEKDLTGGQALLTGLGGNGLMDLMICKSGRGGYYKSNPDGSFIGYQDFEAYPGELLQPQSEWVDLSGRGFNDLFVNEGKYARIYPSLQHKGFGNPVYVDLPDGFPLLNSRSQEELVCFADVFGDGLAHRIRIRGNSVECWPNLGYGRFGECVLLADSLNLSDTCDLSRLQFADINGNGAMDLIYVYPDHFDVFFNCLGNYFSEPISIILPEMYQTIDQIRFVDVDGSGCSSLIFSKMGEQIKHYYYNFSNGVKPYLLNHIDNNMGAKTSISYKSSVSYYLKDKALGREWNTSLPFSVQVVDRIETSDMVSNVSFLQIYNYHDGYYDYFEREFRGFGFVEIQDAQDYQPKQRDFSNVSLMNQEEIIAPPILTKKWFHTGAISCSGTLTRQYEKDYYKGDTKAYLMPDSVLDEEMKASDTESYRLACRTLCGQLLREEVYALDGLVNSKIPYTVKESSYFVHQLQPVRGKHTGIYYISGRENITYQYERNQADPQVKHEFILETDRYANVRKTCTILYPRRRDVIPEADYDCSEQYVLRGMVSISDFATATNGANLLSIPCETKEYELLGLTLNDKLYYSYDEIRKQTEQALNHPIPFGETTDNNLIGVKLLSWERQLYWDSAQEECLKLGLVGERALLHHTEKAVFGDEFIKKTLGDRLTEGMLKQDCGLIQKENYWWNCSQVNYYYKKEELKFHQLYQVENSFVSKEDETYQKTVYQYDSYAMNQLSITRILNDTISLVQSALFDYHVMAPYQITDENDNISQVLFDPLGMVIAATRYGTLLGKAVGGKDISTYQPIDLDEVSLEDIINNNEKYLQGMNFYYYYDYDAWSKRNQPVCSISLQRDLYQDEEETREGHIMNQISFQNGFGKEVEKKVKAERGTAVLYDTDGNPMFDNNHMPVYKEVDTRYIASGRTVYNNKGKPVRQYLTYYTSTPKYESQEYMEQMKTLSIIIHYDPVMRQIRCDKPKGFFTKVEFTPWQARYYDENDTVIDSAYYKEFMDSYPTEPTEREQDEKDALTKAATCYNTMHTKIFDNRGEVYLEISLDDKKKQYFHRKWSDAKGNIVAQADPRLYELNQKEDNCHYSVSYVLNMEGKPIKISSADAGTSYSLYNIYDHEVHTWTARNYHKRSIYDSLQRLTSVKVDGDDGRGLILNQTLEKIIYGESYSDDNLLTKDRNLIGQIYKHFDQAGELTYEDYSLTAKPLHLRRRYCTNYKKEVNWELDYTCLLEEESHLTTYHYDAFDRPIMEVVPSGGKVILDYNQTGLLKHMLLEDAGECKEIISSIQYNAVGQREQVVYGNGVTCNYTYEPSTLRLLSLNSTRLKEEGQNGTSIQNLSYTYDPVGNITRLRDNSLDELINNGQIVKPINDYTFDPLYQLIKVLGRQHPGVAQLNQDSYLYASPIPHRNDLEKLEVYQQQYTYDSAGNLLSTKHQAPSGDWLRTCEIESDSNRTTCITMSGNSYPTEYDPSGNMLGLSSDDHYHWNYRNNLSGVDIILREENISDSEYYVYDSSGQRVRKVNERLIGQDFIEIEETLYIGSYEKKRIYKCNTQQENLILDRDTISVMDGKVRVAIAYHFILDSTKRESDEVDERRIRYQLSNGMGSSVTELNEQAQIITYEEYFPYGGTSLLAGQSEKEVKMKVYRYCGKERDSCTGLYYYGSRYYPPWLARWISPDPAGTDDGLNLYTFVGNNPVTLVDDTGNMGYGWIAGLIGGAVTAVVGVVMGICGTTGIQKGAITAAVATATGMAVSTLIESRSLKDDGAGILIAGVASAGASFLGGVISKYSMKYLMSHNNTQRVALGGTAIASTLGTIALKSMGQNVFNVPSLIGAIGGSVLVSGAHFGLATTGGARLGNLPVEISAREATRVPGWVHMFRDGGLTHLELNGSESFEDIPHILTSTTVRDNNRTIQCEEVVVHGFPSFVFLDEPAERFHKYMNKNELAQLLHDLGYPHRNSVGQKIPIKFVSCYGAFGGIFFSTAQTLANKLDVDVYAAYFPVRITDQGVWHKYKKGN